MKKKGKKKGNGGKRVTKNRKLVEIGLFLKRCKCKLVESSIILLLTIAIYTERHNFKLALSQSAVVATPSRITIFSSRDSTTYCVVYFTL